MILSILQYGDPILRAKGERIEKIDERVRELAANMIETMRAAHGVGCNSPCWMFRQSRTGQAR